MAGPETPTTPMYTSGMRFGVAGFSGKKLFGFASDFEVHGCGTCWAHGFTSSGFDGCGFDILEVTR